MQKTNIQLLSLYLATTILLAGFALEDDDSQVREYTDETFPELIRTKDYVFTVFTQPSKCEYRCEFIMDEFRDASGWFEDDDMPEEKPDLTDPKNRLLDFLPGDPQNN